METTGGSIFSVDRAHSLRPSPQPTLLSGKKWQHFHIVLIFIAFLRGLSDFKWELPIISSTGGGGSRVLVGFYCVIFLFYAVQHLTDTSLYEIRIRYLHINYKCYIVAGITVILLCGVLIMVVFKF